MYSIVIIGVWNETLLIKTLGWRSLLYFTDAWFVTAAGHFLSPENWDASKSDQVTPVEIWLHMWRNRQTDLQSWSQLHNFCCFLCITTTIEIISFISCRNEFAFLSLFTHSTAVVLEISNKANIISHGYWSVCRQTSVGICSKQPTWDRWPSESRRKRSRRKRINICHKCQRGTCVWTTSMPTVYDEQQSVQWMRDACSLCRQPERKWRRRQVLWRGGGTRSSWRGRRLQDVARLRDDFTIC